MCDGPVDLEDLPALAVANPRFNTMSDVRLAAKETLERMRAADADALRAWLVASRRVEDPRAIMSVD